MKTTWGKLIYDIFYKKLVTLSLKLPSFTLEIYFYFSLSEPNDFQHLRIILVFLSALVLTPFYSLSDLDTSLLTMLTCDTEYSTVYCNVVYRPGISEKPAIEKPNCKPHRLSRWRRERYI
jgi:hypothetical protein